MNNKGIKYAVVGIDPSSIVQIDPSLKPVMKQLRQAATAMLDTVPKQEIAQGDYVEAEARGFDSGEGI